MSNSHDYRMSSLYLIAFSSSFSLRPYSIHRLPGMAAPLQVPGDRHVPAVVDRALLQSSKANQLGVVYEDEEELTQTMG